MVSADPLNLRICTHAGSRGRIISRGTISLEGGTLSTLRKSQKQSGEAQIRADKYTRLVLIDEAEFSAPPLVDCGAAGTEIPLSDVSAGRTHWATAGLDLLKEQHRLRDTAEKGVRSR